MVLTKQRKACIAVLAVAGVGLFMDRVIFADSTGPAAASAESLLITHNSGDAAPQPAPTAATPNGPTAPATPAAQANVRTVAERIETLVDQLPTRRTTSGDAFAIPAAWGNPFATKPTAAAAADEAPRRPALSSAGYKLTSVLVNRTDNSLIAVINSEAYRVNDVVGGMTVARLTPGTRTTPGSAVLTRDGDEVELVIQNPDITRGKLTVAPAGRWYR